MKYFFVLGNNTALSVAEIASVFGQEKITLLDTDFLLLETAIEINPTTLINRLGGVIKIGIIKESNSGSKESELKNVFLKLIKDKQEKNDSGKFNFGISTYGKHDFRANNLGLSLKKELNLLKISSRFVVSRDKKLSSVIVTQNKLLSRGVELVLIKDNDKIIFGETLAVQPFKELSKRDYGRPARDDKSGMLPPKLAQVMLNLAQISNNSELVIDPFCGSGTVLSEALVLGYKNLQGFDISPKAIDDTYENIGWIKERYQISDAKVKIFVKNVTKLAKSVRTSSVEAIVTEPFLGPQRGMIDFKTVISNLEELYSQAIDQFRTILKPGGRVVMVWPMFYGQRPINPNYEGFSLINMIPEGLRNSQYIKKNTRPTIIYGRPGQKVYREIVVLDKK